jgi:hypothetical protein
MTWNILGGTLTEFEVLIDIPLAKMKLQELNIMEMRSMTYKWCCSIRGCEHMLACFQVLKPKSTKVKRVMLQLALVIVHMAMKCIDGKDKMLIRSFLSN